MGNINVWLFWLAAAAAQGQIVPLDGTDKTGNVDVLVVDSFGKPIEQPIMTVRRTDETEARSGPLGISHIRLHTSISFQ